MKREIRIALLAGLLAAAVLHGVGAAQSVPEPSPKMTPEMQAVKRQVQVLESSIDQTASQIETSSKAIKKNIEALKGKSVSDIAFEDVFRMLHLQKVELMIELQGLDARSQLLRKKIESSKSETDDTQKMQRVLLKRYVANQESSYETTSKLVAKGARSKEHLLRAKQLLGEAKLRLNEFEMKAREASPEYVEAMFETTLAIAERKAKLQTVESLLKNHIDARPQITEINDLTENRNSEIARLRELIFELSKFKAAQSEF